MVRFVFLVALFAALVWPAGGGARAQDDNQRTREVLACEEAARLAIDRERLITRSISGAQEPDPLVGGGGAGNSFPSEVSKYEEDNRRRRLIDDCLSRSDQAAPAQ